MSPDEKTYKISDVVFTMPELMMGQMEAIQKLVEGDITDPNSWREVVRTKVAKLFSIILQPHKDDVFFANNIKARDPIIQEVIGDFFINYNPVDYCSKNLNAWSKSIISSAGVTSPKGKQ